jgi:uncharacterized membrane protein YcaP (DUF421 family)
MQAGIQVFDLQRIFIGSYPMIYLLEIVFRTVLIYFFTIVIVRFLGKRGRSRMTPIEYVITFALGSAVGDPMFYAEVPLTWSFVIMTTVVVMESLIQYLTKKSDILSNYIEGEPVMVVEKGKLKEENFRNINFGKTEIFTKLREAGFESTKRIKYAYLESSGSMSVITKEVGEYVGNVVSTLPKE